MKTRKFLIVTLLTSWSVLCAAADVQVDDAYIRGEADGQTWRVGNAAVEWVLTGTDGRFRLIHFQNKLTTPPRDYVAAETAVPPFELKLPTLIEQYQIESLWSRYLPNDATADPAGDKLSVTVEAGEMIGFAVGAHGDYAGDQTEWPTTVRYADGQTFHSAADTSLTQGPVWSYALIAPGQGELIKLDAVEYIDNAKENVRIPGPASAYRAPGNAPHVGATMLHPSNPYDSVRVWTAPKAGTVSLSGPARHLRGYGDVDLKVLRIRKSTGPKPTTDDPWTLTSATPQRVNAGGRPAVQFDLELSRPPLRARYHLLAYPRTSILRQWVELENTGTEPFPLAAAAPISLALRGDDATSFTHHWMIGGNSAPDEGQLHSAPVTADYRWQIDGNKTDNFTPWLSLQRTAAPADGWFFVQEYLGKWRFNLDRSAAPATWVFASIPELAGRALAPGEKLPLPLITFGAYQGTLEDMGKRVYDWQYEYQWDATHDDWYGRMQFAVPWYNDVHNLQENFAGRLGDLDINGVDLMRTIGMEILWDDAGWSENPNIWAPSREGPDFSRTLRYLPKLGMKWTLWFCNHPTGELMNGKVGAWGDFQWRTDGQWDFDFALDRAWREKVPRFLRQNPRSSFHTTDCGSRYAHAFEPQRLADINMFTDPGGGDQTNHYLAYLETPDKWMDLMPAFYSGGQYRPDTSRQILTMMPCWDQKAVGEDQEHMRKLCEIYHYLTAQGVAGRWTYLFHPKVTGDTEFYYAQRTSFDRKRACIILKHLAAGAVTVYPVELLPDHEYAVGFDSTIALSKRTGADLMKNGIKIDRQAPGELIYLGLPDRPGSGSDRQAPVSPGSALARRETNLGHTGVAIYWSPGSDNNWVSFYEVRRGSTVLGKASTGTFFFDRAPERDPAAEYSVRTVDGDGNVSPWTVAKPLSGERLEANALGGHFREAGREGWSAEATTNSQTFIPMTFIPPAKNPAGNVGGTGNQPGGVEGYWEAPGTTARVGRGWQQASPTADCVRTWTAPQAGRIRVLGRAVKEYYRNKAGEPLPVRILHNSRQVWPEGAQSLTIKPGDLHGAQHDLLLDVTKGDQLHFVLGRGRSADQDVVAWMPRMVYDEPEPVGSADGVVRIRCGAVEPYTDALGNVWSKDQFFQGGESMALTQEKIEDTQPTATDLPLYQGGRQGDDFSYAIPVPLGLYAVRLKFAEPQYEYSFQRPMNLSINGRSVMKNVDICQAARGGRRAHERVFRYLVPDAQGKLVLHFTGGFDPQANTGQAMVQAIEVLPEIRPEVSEARTAIPEGRWRPFVSAATAPSHKTAIATARPEVLVCQAEKAGHDVVNDAHVAPAASVAPATAERKTGSAAAIARDAVIARDLQPEHHSVIRVDAGASAEHVDWGGFVWNADYGCPGGHALDTATTVSQATPTLHDQRLYQTARAGRSLAYAFTLPPGLYTVHLKFAELWLTQPGQRPMKITVNGRRIAENWDPATAAGQLGMAADLRVPDVTPDKANRITIQLEATGANDAIVQGIEIE